MPNRRFLPRAEPLEVRAVPATTVILADIDTPMAQLSSFGTVPNWGLPNMPLGDYLLPGMDFRGTTPVPAIPSSGPSHGTYMGGRYALSMIQAGQTPLVEPMVAGDETVGFTSDAIGRAMIAIAQQQAAHNAAHDGVRMVVALPVNPGAEGPIEHRGRAMLAAENVPLSESAGNSGWNFIMPDGPTTLVMEAVKLDGTFESYSNHGSGGTAAIIGYDGLGTSGAAEVGAAWLAIQELAHPGAPAKSIVASVKQLGTVGQVPQTVPLSIAPSSSIRTAQKAKRDIAIIPGGIGKLNGFAHRSFTGPHNGAPSGRAQREHHHSRR